MSRLAADWRAHGEHVDIRLMYAYTGQVNALAFSPNSKNVAGLVYNPWQTKTHLCLWDTEKGSSTWHKEVADTSAQALAFSRYVLATGSNKGQVTTWNVKDGSALMILEQHDAPVLAAAFQGDGKLLATTARDAIVQLHDSDSDEALVAAPTYSSKGHDSRVTLGTALAFSLAGHLIAVGGEDGSLRLWSKDFDSTSELGGHRGAVRSLMFTNAQHLVSWSVDGTLCIWDQLSDYEFVSTLQAHADFACVDRAGEILVTAHYINHQSVAKTELRVWRVEDGRLLADLQDTLGDLGEVTALALSPDGRCIALGAEVGPPLLIKIE